MARLRYQIAELGRPIAEAEQAEQHRQDGQRLVKEEVDEADAAEIVGRWTGIPTSRPVTGDVEKPIAMDDRRANAWSAGTRPARPSPTPSTAPIPRRAIQREIVLPRAVHPPCGDVHDGDAVAVAAA